MKHQTSTIEKVSARLLLFENFSWYRLGYCTADIMSHKLKQLNHITWYAKGLSNDKTDVCSFKRATDPFRKRPVANLNNMHVERNGRNFTTVSNSGSVSLTARQRISWLISASTRWRKSHYITMYLPCVIASKIHTATLRSKAGFISFYEWWWFVCT